MDNSECNNDSDIERLLVHFIDTNLSKEELIQIIQEIKEEKEEEEQQQQEKIVNNEINK